MSQVYISPYDYSGLNRVPSKDMLRSHYPRMCLYLEIDSLRYEIIVFKGEFYPSNCFLRSRNWHTQLQRHTESNVTMEAYTATSQGMWRFACSHQKLEEGHGTDFPSKLPEKSNFANTMISGLLVQKSWHHEVSFLI